jgi:hypothetical protein
VAELNAEDHLDRISHDVSTTTRREKCGLAFVVQLGDCIRNAGSPEAAEHFLKRPVIERNWTRFRELAGELSWPLYLALGNHDQLNGETLRPGESPQRLFVSALDCLAPKPIGSSYYQFRIGGYQFVVLPLLGSSQTDTPAVLSWLERELSSGMPAIVIQHAHLLPPARPGRVDACKRDRQPVPEPAQ